MSDQRASDQDRERVAQQLREHYAAGRLSDDELSDRVQAVYDARTDGELQQVIGDLPMLPAVREQQKRAEMVARRRHLQRRLLQQTGGSVIAFLICTAIWIGSGAHGQFWPIWVALAALIPLLKNGWDLYGPAPQLDRVEENLARREQHELGRSERRDQRQLERSERRDQDRRHRR